jgi:hypothetical protein
MVHKNKLPEELLEIANLFEKSDCKELFSNSTCKLNIESYLENLEKNKISEAVQYNSHVPECITPACSPQHVFNNAIYIAPPVMVIICVHKAYELMGYEAPGFIAKISNLFLGHDHLS